MKLSLLIKISRPLGWIVGPIVFLIGFFYVGKSLSVLPVVQILLLSFPYCLFLYGINDIYDYESDRLNPRKNVVEGVKLEKKNHSFVKKASLFMVILLVISSLLTLNITNIFGMFLLLFFSYFYSAPPLRLKEKPPLDSFSNGIFYFFAPFLLGFSFYGTLFDVSSKIYLITLCVVGIHSFSTIMDYSVDKKVGDKTFAVVFGKRNAAFFAFFVFVIAILFAGIQTFFISAYLVFCALLFFIYLIYPSEKLALVFFKLVYIGFLIIALLFLFF